MKSSLKGWVHRIRAQHVSHKKPYPTVELVNFRPKGHAVNFGDELSPVIVDLTLASRGHTRFDEAHRATRLLSIGSIMHMARDGDAIWGTGVNGKTPENYHKFSMLDVRAVRGPLTREFLRQHGLPCPEVYGDPGLLLPHLSAHRFDEIVKSIAVAFVPNLNDLDLPIISTLKMPLITPLQSWHRAVAEILSAEFIIASSLHGLIVAEAYGIPARYVRLSEREALFKYHDYYEGTGRTNVRIATSLEEALELGGAEPPRFDKEALINSFPIDLWR